jgi:NAD(P)-dependent dehydrogenase (short-subunit alcohol dehydrogenase family)
MGPPGSVVWGADLLILTDGGMLAIPYLEVSMSEQSQLAVVTGASSGIGEATVRALAARGFHVLAGVRREADGDQISGQSIEPVILDITDAAHVATIAERVEHDPDGRRLGVLVNNAGIAGQWAVRRHPDGRVAPPVRG